MPNGENDIRVRVAGDHVRPKGVLSQTFKTRQPPRLPSERQPIANSPLGDETKTARVRSLISGPTHHQQDAQCSDWTCSRIGPRPITVLHFGPAVDRAFPFQPTGGQVGFPRSFPLVALPSCRCGHATRSEIPNSHRCHSMNFSSPIRFR